MPWKECSIMTQRLKLIEQMLLPGSNIGELAASAGISRKTAYKWLSRYKERGFAGLADRSRSAISRPNRASSMTEEVVIELHHKFPYWGPYKLNQYLIHNQVLSAVPSHTTIGRILKRYDCEVIKSHRQQKAYTRFERSQPNDLWQMDFKGHFMLQSKRCHPLTIIDDHSRFSIALDGCLEQSGSLIETHLTRVFKEYGMPQQINTDNGSPWGSRGGPSKLFIWLAKLGIELSYSRPYHPQTNGKDERFHRTLKLEVLHDREYRSLSSIQEAFDYWRHSYNFERPHQGIDNQTPSTRYQVSTRCFPDKMPEPEYSTDEVVKKACKKSALFRFKGHRFRAGKGLAGEYISIRETNQNDQFSIFFMNRFIKKFSMSDAID